MRSNQRTGGRDVNPRVLNMLAKQQFDLVRNPANGVIFYQNEDGDVLDIQADIIGPVQTAYEGGIFRCKLVIENGFPQSAPKGFFLTKIHHPNVAQNTGEICVNTLKRDWNPAKWSLKHIFEVIKCLLIVPFPESSLNEEAGREFMDDYGAFCEHARVYTQIHAKPNAAQRELMAVRQREEEKEQEASKVTPQQPRQQPISNSSQRMQENTTSESSQPTPSAVQNDQQDVEMVTPTKINMAGEEEIKLEVVIPSNSSLQSLSQQQQVLSQVTNSFERPANGQQTQLLLSQKGDNCQMALGGSQWKHSGQLQMQPLSALDSRNSFDTQNMMIDTSYNSQGGARQFSSQQAIASKQRPSVLFKKKTETAKQRQERYIRRV